MGDLGGSLVNLHSTGEALVLTSIRHVLVPIDFSDDALHALDHALELARGLGARVHLLHVLERVVTDETGIGCSLPQMSPDRLLDEAEEALKAMAVRYSCMKDSGCPLVTAVAVGSPAESIVRYARSHDIDLVVMGTHGKRELSRILIGSTAASVVHQSDCPVLTIRHPRRGGTDEAMAPGQGAPTQAPGRFPYR